jgi:hypothetical protein
MQSKTKVSEEHKKYLLKKFKYAAEQFGKAGTRSNHSKVPKEQQLSIDLGNKSTFGIVNRILYWIESKFTYFFPRYSFFTEVGTEERKIPGTNSKVKYFTLNEQIEHHKITYNKKLYENLMPRIEGDKLKGFTGKLFDTSSSVSKGKRGYAAYVITLDKKLITHNHVNPGQDVKYSYRHSTLAGGKTIICSSLIQVINGKITYIDNDSGHYKPTSANLYNAVKILEELFSENAKVVCLGLLGTLLRKIPIIRKILAKEESVEKFLERMEKKGRDELTEYERHFARIKKHNEGYSRQLNSQSVYAKVVAPSYKSVPIEGINNPLVMKMTIERSIRRIIGADYGHKPNIDIEHYRGEVCGVSITFRYKEDTDRFMKTLNSQQCMYTSRAQENKYKITMSTEQAHIFIKNTLEIKIDSIEQLDITTQGCSSRSA